MRTFVTGGAGFIGSHLVDRLLGDGHTVTVYDNFSTGRREFLADAARDPRFTLVEGDLLDAAALGQALAGHDFVFHLAANADVRFGTKHPRRDLEQNTIATFNVLEAMRGAGIERIAFSSTGSVYGEPEVFPTPEACPFPVQTSLYGASKLAGEALIQAFCTGFRFQGFIFRFVSLLGERYTHGHVVDFFRKLRKDPRRIEVLGDGKQRKSYLYVRDCVDAMVRVIGAAHERVNICNLGTEEYCSVDDSLGWICGQLGVAPVRCYTGGPRGWVGDSPFIYLDTARVRALGWKPSLTIREAVLRTVAYLQAHQEPFERNPMAAGDGP
jgi:UDP-glucose 4-epimerase